MTPVAAPADKRFRRSHVKPGRRRRNWRAAAADALRFAVVGGAIAYGIYRASAVLAATSALRVGRIVVRGNERLSNGEVLAVLNGLRGESLVWTDLNKWRARLLASSWVRDASLRRSLPSTIEVVVTERQPIALARIGGEMYLVDEHGVVVDQYGPQYADFDLPIVDGLVVKKSGRGASASEEAAELAARVVASIGTRPQIARRLSQIDVADRRNVSVILDGDPAEIQLGEDQFVERLEAYLDLADALRERVADIDYVDLRFDDRIYVRPAFRRGGRKPSALRRDELASPPGDAARGPATRR